MVQPLQKCSCLSTSQRNRIKVYIDVSLQKIFRVCRETTCKLIHTAATVIISPYLTRNNDYFNFIFPRNWWGYRLSKNTNDVGYICWHILLGNYRVWVVHRVHVVDSTTWLCFERNTHPMLVAQVEGPKYVLVIQPVIAVKGSCWPLVKCVHVVIQLRIDKVDNVRLRLQVVHIALKNRICHKAVA